MKYNHTFNSSRYYLIINRWLLALLLSFSSLTVLAVDDDSYEENDSLETSYDLSGKAGLWLDDPDEGLGLGIQFDDEWYKIYVESGDRVTVDLQFESSNSSVDRELALIMLLKSHSVTRQEKKMSKI